MCLMGISKEMLNNLTHYHRINFVHVFKSLRDFTATSTARWEKAAYSFQVLLTRILRLLSALKFLSSFFLHYS
jgi:hypothetical protein